MSNYPCFFQYFPYAIIITLALHSNLFPYLCFPSSLLLSSLLSVSSFFIPPILFPLLLLPFPTIIMSLLIFFCTYCLFSLPILSHSFAFLSLSFIHPVSHLFLPLSHFITRFSFPILSILSPSLVFYPFLPPSLRPSLPFRRFSSPLPLSSLLPLPAAKRYCQKARFSFFV